MKSFNKPESLYGSGFDRLDTRQDEIKHTFDGNYTGQVASMGNLSGQSSRPCVRLVAGQRLKPASGDLSPAHKNTLGVTETMNSASLSPIHAQGRGGTVISKDKIGFSSYKGSMTINSQGFNHTLDNFTPKRAFVSMQSKKKTQIIPKLEEIEEFPHREEPRSKLNRKPYETTVGVESVNPPPDAFKFLVKK